MARIIGLTGGIGSGKSTIMQYIESLGYKVYYADLAGKKIMEQKSVINRVVALLGLQVLNENAKLDRKKIGLIVFNDPEKLKKLNEIIHPEVANDFNDFVRNLPEDEIVVKESAILFETNADALCEFTILITAPKELRIQRVMKRDFISEEEVLQRMQNQLSDEIKSKKANFVINNISINKSYGDIFNVLDKIKNIYR